MPQHEGIELIYGNLAPVIFSINLCNCRDYTAGAFCLAVCSPAGIACAARAAAYRNPGHTGQAQRSFSAALLRSLVLMISSLAGIADMLKRRRAHPDRMQAAAEYAGLLAAGTERFFDPRSETCPLCAGGALTRLLQAHEPVMHKPGTFSLEQCRACGHIFQNPPLNAPASPFITAICTTGWARL